LTGWFGSLNGRWSPDNPRVEPPISRVVVVPQTVRQEPPLAMLEHFATPGEFMGERDAAVAMGDQARLAQLDGSLTGIDLAKFAQLQPFRRVEVASGATLYRGPGARRRLLIAFGANAGVPAMH
jgi:hypothetical protein